MHPRQLQLQNSAQKAPEKHVAEHGSGALQSALRNMGVLGYAVYMAMLANS